MLGHRQNWYNALGNLYNGFVLDGMVIMSSFGAAASNATLAGVKREGGKGNEKEGNGGGGGGGFA